MTGGEDQGARDARATARVPPAARPARGRVSVTSWNSSWDRARPIGHQRPPWRNRGGPAATRLGGRPGAPTASRRPSCSVRQRVFGKEPPWPRRVSAAEPGRCYTPAFGRPAVDAAPRAAGPPQGGRPHGGCSSGVERRIVDPEVAGSKPVTHPNFFAARTPSACVAAALWARSRPSTRGVPSLVARPCAPGCACIRPLSSLSTLTLRHNRRRTGRRPSGRHRRDAGHRPRGGAGAPRAAARRWSPPDGASDDLDARLTARDAGRLTPDGLGPRHHRGPRRAGPLQFRAPGTPSTSS